MRVAFFGQSGPFGPPVLRRLLIAQESFDIVLVVEGRKVPLHGRENRLFAAAPRPVPPSKVNDLSTLANASGIDTLVTSNVNGTDAVHVLQQYRPDWIVCAGFDRLFSPDVLRTARTGAINAHPSPLPQWRGPSPMFWIVKSGSRKGGVTLHAMDEREDHGEIYAQESFVLPRRASSEQLYSLAGELAARMLVPVLAMAARGTLRGVAQEPSGTPRARYPIPVDAAIEPGLWKCEHLVDFVCAASAFCLSTLRLDDRTLFVRHGLLAEPGRRLGAAHRWQNGVLVVECEDGVAHLDVREIGAGEIERTRESRPAPAGMDA